MNKISSLPLFKTQNNNYISPKISIKELETMCNEYFQVIIIENKYKESDFSPDYKILVIGDKK